MTLVELMVCIAIVGVVAAVALPAFSAAKISSKKTASKNALHQNWVALMLYREDYGGGVDHGTSIDMALPPDDSIWDLPVDPPYHSLNGGLVGFWAPATMAQRPEVIAEWIRYTERCRTNSVLLGDRAYDDAPLQSATNYPLNTLLGVRLSGKIEQRTAPNFMGSPFWFACESSTSD